MGKYTPDHEKYASLARQAIAEGCVLIKNNGNALPLKNGQTIALFGRGNYNYYKSGLGSGGLVNTRYVVSVLDALKDCNRVTLQPELMQIYEEWLEENPYDAGHGWGTVPWCQEEMPVTERMCEIAAQSDAAIITIARTAGEDQDNNEGPGSFLLTEKEEKLVEEVSKAAKKTIVLLNVGNIIDMRWVEKYNVDAVMYIWQGGQEGGNGVLDLLLGDVNPSGRLTDTIAYTIEDYPSAPYFGDKKRNFYVEDVYVGYRYFETFAPDKVLYPFGYGLSYTTFEVIPSLEWVTADELHLSIDVSNTGTVSGKNSVLVYIEAPQGKIGQPVRKLIGFAKTETLLPGEKQLIALRIPKTAYATFDDAGVIAKDAFVLEAGTYTIYAGGDVRSALPAGEYKQDEVVLEQLSDAYAPALSYERMRPVRTANGYEVAFEQVPLRSMNQDERQALKPVPEIPYTGDRGYKLIDVYDGKVQLADFVAQIDDQNLMAIFRGEGMCSPKVTPGTAGAFGGTTEALKNLGVPVGCCADGPSGIRMDCGTCAFSLPNGAIFASALNEKLAEELFEVLGLELRMNRIDSLLGPGMNIHRHPLNGRNFEYFSEDPIITGKIAAAEIRGNLKCGIGSTIKHFTGNNQESARRFSDSVISERALREIYLKGFEIAIKEGGCRSVMTTYGGVNGLWTAGSYDLCTTILRDEWGFEGIVISDWWATANYEGSPCDVKVKAPMVFAQNDVYMLVNNSLANPENDDVEEQLKAGYITRGMLQRNAINILKFLLKSQALLRLEGRLNPEELKEIELLDGDDAPAANLEYFEMTGDVVTVDGSVFHPAARTSEQVGITEFETGFYDIIFYVKSDLSELAQQSVSVYFDNVFKCTVSTHGLNGGKAVLSEKMGFAAGANHFLKLFYGADGLEIEKVELRIDRSIDPDWRKKIFQE